jgi:CRISPR-associated protein Cmr6
MPAINHRTFSQLLDNTKEGKLSDNFNANIVMKKLPIPDNQQDRDDDKNAMLNWAVSTQFGRKGNKTIDRIIETAKSRREKALIALGKTYHASVWKISLTATSDTIVGIAAFSNVLENALSLHSVYGVPILPATAVRGCIRAGREELKRENRYTGNTEIEQYCDRDAKMIWGHDDTDTQTSVPSKAVFFDALIDGFVKKDIINQHNWKYYKEKGAPDGTDNPKPVSMISIAADMQVNLYFALSADDICKKHLRYILRDVRYAVEEMGLGAKTSSGYGFFKIERQGHPRGDCLVTGTDENGEEQGFAIGRWGR